MSDQLHSHPATGAHPTAAQFVEQLTAWGFTRLKEDDVHVVFKAPKHGGAVRVIRSLLGRADLDQVEKATRLLDVSVEQFWAGPPPPDQQQNQQTEEATRQPRAAKRRRASRDRITSLVLAIHAQEDRPLGFDQVVDLAGGRVTREQVRNASSQLCREGDLDRIRSGVYQWAEGVRALHHTTTTTPTPRGLRILHPTTPAPAQPRPAETPTAASTTPPTPKARLFAQLFPNGIRMTAEQFSVFEQWAKLTEQLGGGYPEPS